MAKTSCSQCRGPGFNPWSENYIPHHAANKSSRAATKKPTYCNEDLCVCVCVCVCVSESLSHAQLCNPVDCSPPGSSVHRISQARVLEWVVFLLQGIFLTWGSKPDLLHCRWILYHLSHQGSFI